MAEIQVLEPSLLRYRVFISRRLTLEVEPGPKPRHLIWDSVFPQHLIHHTKCSPQKKFLIYCYYSTGDYKFPAEMQNSVCLLFKVWAQMAYVQTHATRFAKQDGLPLGLYFQRLLPYDSETHNWSKQAH